MRDKLLIALAAIAILVGGRASARPPETYKLDPKSRFEVKTGTAGLLGGLAHEHRIRAKDPRGTIVYDASNLAACAVEVEVDAATLTVEDEGLDDDDRKEITETLKGDEVLDVKRHGTIRFRSTKVEGDSPEKLRVRGELTLHGTTRAVEVALALALEEGGARLRAKGSFKVKTSDYGMKPYSAGLGTIKVADEVTFEIDAVGAR